MFAYLPPRPPDTNIKVIEITGDTRLQWRPRRDTGQWLGVCIIVTVLLAILSFWLFVGIVVISSCLEALGVVPTTNALRHAPDWKGFMVRLLTLALWSTAAAVVIQQIYRKIRGHTISVYVHRDFLTILNAATPDEDERTRLEIERSRRLRIGRRRPDVTASRDFAAGEWRVDYQPESDPPRLMLVNNAERVEIFHHLDRADADWLAAVLQQWSD